MAHCEAKKTLEGIDQNTYENVLCKQLHYLSYCE